jgi:hypothetical protein
MGDDHLIDAFGKVLEDVKIFAMPVFRSLARGEKLTQQWKGRERMGILMNPRNMSRELLSMEELWEPLSREEARLKSPPWHKEALRETGARHDAGKEQPIDWDAAKRELRKRTE